MGARLKELGGSAEPIIIVVQIARSIKARTAHSKSVSSAQKKKKKKKRVTGTGDTAGKRRRRRKKRKKMVC